MIFLAQINSPGLSGHRPRHPPALAIAGCLGLAQTYSRFRKSHCLRPLKYAFNPIEFAPTAKQISHFKKLIARRAKGEPIAYLIGHKEFYGLDFEINKNVLIPRPETELMVEEVVKKIDRLKIILIDVGTGSGCIPIAILKTIKNTATIKCFAIDISPGAIATAKRNAKKHNVKIKFLHGNLLEPMMSQLTQYSKKNKIIITANLPYL
ncbi:MAG: Release factor glutamine methyltransferase, partial [Candidatus Magasanikbacteria bacterium GW2011_GWA2_42_32]